MQRVLAIALYQMSGIYLSARFLTNLSQVSLPLYLQETLQLHATYVAIIPLVMIVAAFLATYVVNYLNEKFGCKFSYLLGSIACGGAAMLVFYGEDWCGDWFETYSIYGVAFLYGIGGITVLVSSLALTSELIAQNNESAGFVYGVMSFTEKVSNGLIVMLIQTFVPSFQVGYSIN